MVERTPSKETTWDIVIVGGGSAGCVLANRLSADPSARVLVLEAGPMDHRWDFRIHMPAALAWPLAGHTYNWWYESGPEPGMGGRRIYQPRGKVLGGSSSINGMVWIRGNPLDYERWGREPGLADWNFAHCLPYFRRLEHRLSGADTYHGDSGPLFLTTPRCDGPLVEAFFAAAQQAGYPLTEDVNGFQQEGFSGFDRTTYRGRRWSTARAYYHPIKRRKNLTLKCRALTTRILFDERRAVGVEYRHGGQQHAAYGNEIICCGGAINSPQLLQLSGVGPADRLKRLGITVIQDLPGVGETLQDHLEVYVQYACTQPVSLYPALAWWRQPWIGAKWLFGRRGIGASNQFEAGGFIRSNDQVDIPNVQFHFLPIAIRYDGSAPNSGHGYQVHVGPTLSDARGWVRIRSSDPDEHPSIRFNYVSTEQDRREWVEAIRCARHIMNQPALEPLRGEELVPGVEVETDEDILSFVAREGESAYHPCCTCRMGADDGAVTDTELRVHALDGLRVVDASAMPSITNGNIYAPVLMIAEKAADMIRGDTLLEPSTAPFHTHAAAS